MVEPGKAVSTVTFIDNSCALSRDLFVEVRSFEAFQYLHPGMISELVLADSLYDQSSAFVGFLDQLKLPWMMAIRSNHGV